MEKFVKFTVFSANLRPISETISLQLPILQIFNIIIWSILGLEHVIIRSQIHTNWNIFSILLDPFAHFRSELAIVRADFIAFPTSYVSFGSFMISFEPETCSF